MSFKGMVCNVAESRLPQIAVKPLPSPTPPNGADRDNEQGSETNRPQRTHFCVACKLTTATEAVGQLNPGRRCGWFASQ